MIRATRGAAGIALACLLAAACASPPTGIAAASQPTGDPAERADLAVARALAQGGLPALALRQLQELGADGPESWRLRGQCLDRLGKPEAAHAAFRRALDMAPEQAAFHNDLGFSLLAAGDLEAAEPRLVRALELDPGLSAARTNLALLRVLADDEAGALAILTSRAEPSQALSDLGAVLELAGHPERARSRYREALGLDPGQPGARANLARLGEPDIEGALP